jgi:hypothetical protein
MADRIIFWGPTIALIVYLATAVAFGCKKNYAFTLTYFAYALANVGLIWAASR